MEEEYEEAIAYFQKYPDMWTKLLNGIVAKRNRGFDEATVAMEHPQYADRRDTIYGLYCKSSAFDEIARDFSGDYSEPPETSAE